MKALIWEAPRVMALKDYPDPPVGPGEALVKVAYAGICGSELSGYLGLNALRVPPLVMGHEFSGEIVALGADAQARYPGLAVAQAVTVNPLISCGSCEYCKPGLNHLCASRQLVGAHRPGAFAQYVAVPAESLAPLPEGMSMRLGALAEPAAVGVRIGEMAGPLDRADVLVIGAGPIGLLALQALSAKGAARVFIADLSPDRLAMGAALGGLALDPTALDVARAVRAATGGRGVAVGVDAVGTAVTRRQAIIAVRSAGTVIMTGLHEETSAVPAAEIIRREIVVRGCFAYRPADFAEALGRLSREAMRLDPWIAEAPLADGGHWFDRLVHSPAEVAKVLLRPWPAGQ